MSIVFLGLRKRWGLRSCGKMSLGHEGRRSRVWNPGPEGGGKGSTVHNRFCMSFLPVTLPGIQALCAVAVFHLSLPSSLEPASPLR